jgi:hypothetical protein
MITATTCAPWRTNAAVRPVPVARSTSSSTAPVLRLIVWDDGTTSIDPEDYEVIDERGARVGRLYRTIAVGGGEAWRWTIYAIVVGDHPPAGTAPTREAAQAAFKAAGAICKPRERGA